MIKGKMKIAARLVVACAFMITALFSTGCVNGVPVIFDDYPHYIDDMAVTLKIKAKPYGTKIYMNGRYMGKTPLVIRTRINEPFVEVVAVRRGFRKGVFYDHFLHDGCNPNQYVHSSVSSSKTLTKIRYRARLSFRLPPRRGHRH